MNDTALLCEGLHRLLEKCQSLEYPISWKELPANGVYFFYEDGESWGHGGKKPRIVRVGTHRKGNMVSRIKSHYVGDAKIDHISLTSSCPKDRSIFRKNIGRAILATSERDYLPTWNIDFQIEENRTRYARQRNIKLEKQTERSISGILRDHFSFRIIPTADHAGIIGGPSLESRLIGTVANCGRCKPSAKWLGLSSPDEKIQRGLWVVHHIASSPLTAGDMRTLVRYCR